MAITPIHPDNWLDKWLGTYTNLPVWSDWPITTKKEEPKMAELITPTPAIAVAPLATDTGGLGGTPPMISNAQLETILGKNIYTWLNIAPQNELIRGHILTKTSIYVPDEIAPEGIKDWLKTKLAEKIKPVADKVVVAPPPQAPSVFASVSIPQPVLTAPTPVPQAPVITHDYQVPLSYTSNEHGNASFTRQVAMEGRIVIGNATLLEMWEEADHDESEFENLIDDHVRQIEQDNGYCRETDTINCDYDNQEVFESNDEDWEVSSRAIIEEFLEINGINHPEEPPENIDEHMPVTPIIPEEDEDDETEDTTDDDDEETDEESGEEEEEDGEEDTSPY